MRSFVCYYSQAGAPGAELRQRVEHPGIRPAEIGDAGLVVTDEGRDQIVGVLRRQPVALDGLGDQRHDAVPDPVSREALVHPRMSVALERQIQRGIDVRRRVHQRAVEIEQVSRIRFQSAASALRMLSMVAR